MNQDKQSEVIERLKDNRPRVGEDWPDYCARVRPLMDEAAAYIAEREAQIRIRDGMISRMEGQIAAMEFLTTPSRPSLSTPSEGVIERLREALEPFARLLKRDDPRTSDAAMVLVQYGFTKMHGLSVRDLRRARAALARLSPLPLVEDNQ